MTSCGWLWLYFGAGLMVLELASTGFVIFFFGLSAATVGVIRLLVGEGFGSIAQVAAFSVFAVLYLAILRRWMKRIFSGETSRTETDFNNDYIGRIGTAVSAIEPPHAGRVEIGDAAWTAEAEAPVAVGRSVRIIALDNLTVKVEEIR